MYAIWIHSKSTRNKVTPYSGNILCCHCSKLIYTYKGWSNPVTCVTQVSWCIHHWPWIPCCLQSPAVDIVGIGLENGKLVIHNLRTDETMMNFQQDWGPITSVSFRTGNTIILNRITHAVVVIYRWYQYCCYIKFHWTHCCVEFRWTSVGCHGEGCSWWECWWDGIHPITATDGNV